MDETNKGFVDESTRAPSISEDVLTVGMGAPGDEDSDDNSMSNAYTKQSLIKLQHQSDITAGTGAAASTTATTDDDITPDPRLGEGWAAG